MRKPKGRNRTFQSHGAGKGSADRTTDDRAFRENWDNIDWNRPAEKIPNPSWATPTDAEIDDAACSL